jgi:PAS domain S-box-containing protein
VARPNTQARSPARGARAEPRAAGGGGRPRAGAPGRAASAAREPLWRQLFEEVPEPAFLSDASGRILAANRAATRRLESRSGPLDGRPVAEMVVEPDRLRVGSLLERLHTSRRAVLETELNFLRTGRTSLSAAVTLVGLRGEGARLRAVGWLLRRLDEPRSLAESLQRTRQEASDLRLALDQAAALLSFDEQGRIEEANDRACRILGRAREQVVGCSLADLGLGSDADQQMPDIRGTLARGDVWGGELRISAADGNERWLHCTMVAVLDEGGRPGHVLAILYDVTERRLATERLIEQEGLARLGALAAVVAHEVRNPLAAARGALQVIGPRVESEGDRRILGDVVERLTQLDGLVDDILLYARPRPLVLQDTDLMGLVERAISELAGDPQTAGVEVALVGSRERCPTRVDAGALQRVLLNLLRNAAQAMERRGRILVEVERTEAAVRVRVRDEGPGIPAELREKIFEPFFTTKHKGSGLGLATARRTVELHGGHLLLRPGPSGGTDAIVELPRP